jgi:hypothetical protein
LVLVIICTGLVLRIFGRIELRGKEWQARAERGGD